MPPALTLEQAKLDQELSREISNFYADPLGFVLFAFPWGVKGGPLEHHQGPDEWQRQFLVELGQEVFKRGFNGTKSVAPIRMTRSSGHGIGKSVCVAFLVCWLMSTRPGCVGTITANSFPQLSTKTWATIKTWHKRLINAHWFTVTNDRFYYTDSPESWFCAAATAKEESSESFAGQHAADATSFYIFDEASAIPEKIWEVAEGGLTDGEPMIFAWGNPTRSYGKFYKINFGSDKEDWNHATIDSRRSRFTNKETIDKWILDRGLDSDFVRVRVLGLPPAASDVQFIDLNRVGDAQTRQVEVFDDEPLVAGLDISRGGQDNAVIYFRRGLDARSIPPKIIPGEKIRDSNVLISIVAEILRTPYGGRLVKAMFADGTGVGGPIIDRLKLLGHKNVHEVQFGSSAPDERHYANMRAWMWDRMKEFLLRGAIWKNNDLELQLITPMFSFTKRDQLLLESKENIKSRGEQSPDIADGLALTFAKPVGPEAAPPPPRRPLPSGGRSGNWMM